MTVEAAEVTYRVRIATRGASTVPGNVDLTLSIDDLVVPTLTGPSVDVLRGTTTSHPFGLDCIVDSVLFVDSGRLAIIGRLIEIQRSEDDGMNWTTLATGRISGASELDGKGKISLRVSDERWAERKTQIFERTTSVQLHPPGLASAFMDEPAAGTAIYEVVDVDGSAVKVRAANIGSSAIELEAPASLREALATDLVPTEDRDNEATNSAGNFTELRFRWTETNGSPITASDNRVISFRQSLGAGILTSTRTVGLLAQMSPEGSGVLLASWLYLGSGHGLVAGDEITGRFYWPTSGSGIPTSESVPVHIGGSDGIHPMTLLKDILDGDHGGDAVLYDASALSDLEALSFERVWVREAGPADRAKWLEKNLYPVFNVTPLVGTDLATRPTALRLPQDIDPATLTTIDASSASNTDWDHTSGDLVNVIRFSSRVLRRLSKTKDLGENWPVDRLEPLRQHVADIEHDNVATLGRVARDIDTDLVISKFASGFTTRNDVSRALAQEIFDVFGDGPARGEVTVADDADVEVGDLVIFDQDTLKGFNPGTADRTGDRIVRLITFRELAPAHTVFEYLDLGPNSAVLAAPGVSVAQNSTDADLIDVTISGLGAGETAVVEATVVASGSPTEFDFRRSGVGNETIQFRVAASSGTAHARAYAFAPNRIRSPWASDSVALSTRATIDNAEVERLLTTAEVTWDVPSDTLGMRTRYSIHNRNAAPSFANQADFDAADGGFTISGFTGDRQMVSVELTPYPGWDGNNVTGTAGVTIVIEAVLRKIDGGIFLRRAPAPTGSMAFDVNGNLLISAQGDEEAAVLYVTVGDGASPADPTAAANDGSIAGRSGTLDTGIAITGGNSAFAKVVAADANGDLGPVTELRLDRVSQGGAGEGLKIESGALALDIDGLTDVSTETAPDDVAKGTDQLAFSRGAALFKDTFNTIPLSIFDDDITGGALETASTGLTAVGSDVQVEYTGGADSLVGAAADGTGGGDLETTDRILFADDSDLFDVKFALVDQLPFTSNVGDITDVTAGDGLVGGGASGAVTLDVDPGDGIVISGDAVTVNPDEGISVGAGGVRLDIDGLTDVSTESAPDDELLGTDQIVFSRGASLFKDTANTIPLSAFLDDITGGGLETASTGLTTVGSDVQVEYTGSVDSVIGAAPDFTGTIAGADNILIADGGNTGDVKAVSLAEIDVGVFDDDGTYLTPGEAVTSVGAATGLDSSGGTTPQISLSFDELADRTLDDTDKLVFYSPGGAGHFTDIVSGIGLSNFLNDAGFSSGALETASTGLTTVGSDVQVEYTGSVDSIIGAAPDFTGTVSSADNILIADGGNTGDVFAVSLAEVEGELSIGASQITAGTFGSGNYTIQGALFLEDADPQYFLTETDAALNEKRWRIVAASGSLFFQGREDQGETFANPTFMRFRRSGTSAVGVDFSGAPLRAVNGTQGAPSYAFVNDTDTGIFRPSSDILGLVAGGNEHLRIDGASTTNRVSVRSAQFYVEEQGSVLESATVTPDFDDGNQVRITNDGTVTEIDVSTSGIQHGGSYILIIEAQTGTPQSSITWTGVDGWENGEPELTQTVGDATLVLLLSSAGLGVMGSWRHIVA